MKKLLSYSFLVMVLFFGFSSIVYAAILSRWDDPNAYKPEPILFVHGFGVGSSSGWEKISGELKQYYSPYGINPTFLETIDFNDPNGSVDTYSSGKFNPQGNNAGWADKLKKRVKEISDKYNFKGVHPEVNLICHSMGGLAAREYVTNPKYRIDNLNVSKIVAIGSPLCGSSLANITEVHILWHYYLVWEIPGVSHADFFTDSISMAAVMNLVKGTLKWDFNGEAFKDMAIKSEFLKSLNARFQPLDIKNYAIFGKIDSRFNMEFFQYYYPYDPLNSGDVIVPIHSQQGYDMYTDYPDSSKFRWVWKVRTEEVRASHMTELTSDQTLDKIKSCLDDNKPEFHITSHSLDGITKVQENFIKLKGEVSKVYWPASAKLYVEVEKQGGGEEYRKLNFTLMPSNLWMPNDPDSPVAEFDGTITFSTSGIYKISCHVENVNKLNDPINGSSVMQSFFVQVATVPLTGVRVHCHNPEGKEIASIYGFALMVTIRDGNTWIGGGAYDSATHNKPIPLSAGTHTIKAVFNGMTKEQIVTLAPLEEKEIVFTFERTKFDHKAFLDSIGLVARSQTYTLGGPGNEFYYLQLCPDQKFPYIDGAAGLSTQDVFVTTTVSCTMNINSKTISVNNHATSRATPALLPNFSRKWEYYLGINAQGYLKQFKYTLFRAAVPQWQSTSFNTWYMQKKRSKAIGKGKFELYDEKSTLIATLTDEDKDLLQVLPVQGGISASIYLADAHRYVDWHDQPTGIRFVHIPGNGFFSNSNVWVSNVPYDLAGTGI